MDQHSDAAGKGDGKAEAGYFTCTMMKKIQNPKKTSKENDMKTLIQRTALAFAMVAVLGAGAASAYDSFTKPQTTGWAQQGTVEIHKHMSDHGGFGPGSDMPFMPGSN